MGRTVAAVYTPTIPDLPYLAVVFLACREEPIAMPFETVTEAETCVNEIVEGLRVI
jgi:hypothetical protein